MGPAPGRVRAGSVARTHCNPCTRGVWRARRCGEALWSLPRMPARSEPGKKRVPRDRPVALTACNATRPTPSGRSLRTPGPPLKVKPAVFGFIAKVFGTKNERVVIFTLLAGRFMMSSQMAWRILQSELRPVSKLSTLCQQ